MFKGGSLKTHNLARSVAGNTVWYGAELGITVLAALATSIPVARAFGPAKLSYYTYLQWLTNISGTLAMVGIPATTRKYMAEYLARSDHAAAWAIFRTSLHVQSWIVGGLLLAGSALIAKAVEPGYQVITLLMLCTVGAKLVACIPSNSNIAAGNWRANFIGTALNCVVTVSMVNVSLWAGWGLVGVAATLTAGMLLELLAKMVLVLRWLRRVPDATLPVDLGKRMFRFSGQGIVLMILQIVVWDRSDLVFLRMLDKDKSQVTFFALAFNLIDKILNLPQAFSQVVGVSVMVEYGRNPQNLHRFVSTAVKYGLMVAVPVMVGTAAISSPLIRITYGSQYLPVIPVLIIGSLLATAKPVLGPLQSLFQAEERQGFLIVWTVCCAVVNVLLDVTLIPLAGARGAMAANGLAQVLAIAGIAIKARSEFSVRMNLGVTVRIVIAGVMMAAVVWSVQRAGAPLWVELACGIPIGALVYVLALRLLRVLDQSDGSRLQHLAGRVPGLPGRMATNCIAGMVRKTSIGT